MIQDKLSSIPISWDVTYTNESNKLYLFNWGTTNAVVIDSIMYCLLDQHMIKLTLDPIYTYINNINNQSLPNNNNIQPPNIQPEISTEFLWTHGFQGCLVTDDTKKYLIVAAMDGWNDVLYMNRVVLCRVTPWVCRVAGETQYPHVSGLSLCYLVFDG